MKNKLSRIFKYAGLGIMAVTCILGIVMLSKYVKYNNSKVKPMTETPTEQEFIENSQILKKKDNYKNEALGLIPWTVAFMLVGSSAVAVGIVLDLDKKQLQVK